jgi:tetratricopeptide (TPR) repeat protein
MNDIVQFIRKGLNFAADGKYRDIYDEAIARIKADTGDAAAYFVLGKISADHNNHAKARELFSKAVELAPSNVYCQVYLAQILTLGGEQVAAKQHADIAASLAHDADHHIADTIGVIHVLGFMNWRYLGLKAPFSLGLTYTTISTIWAHRFNLSVSLHRPKRPLGRFFTLSLTTIERCRHWFS